MLCAAQQYSSKSIRMRGDIVGFTIQAACFCSTGLIRKNNEDNFYFDGKTLEEINNGLAYPLSMCGELTDGLCMSVFDGMGGENYGETASFTAAHEMRSVRRGIADLFLTREEYLNRMVLQLNLAVVAAAKALGTNRMGSTMAALYFTARNTYVCNLGDSRAYRLRDGELLQLTKDHVTSRPQKEGKKAPLTQYLGIDPDELQLEPYISKSALQKGDGYLICSDGLTDMVSGTEIADILSGSTDVEKCVRQLVAAAHAHGGRDNITAIVCQIS